ncbi:MAG: hypothetical protein LUO95_10015, partial [Methylococcaceae bacterium]|nr:hypothetical protein [Methylococcaceae bacterium]
GFLSDEDFESRLALLTNHETEKITAKEWIIGLFIKAIENFSNEQDRLDMLVWLTLAREKLADDSLSQLAKFTQLYALIDFKKTIGTVFSSVGDTVKNYTNSDIYWCSGDYYYFAILSRE